MPAAPSTTTPTRPRRRIRWRPIFKWSGLAVCVLMVAVFVVSLRWRVGCSFWSGVPGSGILRTPSISEGGLWYTHYENPNGPASPPERMWFADRFTSHPLWWPQWAPDSPDLLVGIPLWLPFALLAIPTAILFRLDGRSTRRARAGACIKCGYALTGLAPSSPCPECGNLRA